MSESRSLLDWLRDPRVAAHATGAVPAWLWSADASRILWANPVGAAIFDAASPAAIAGHMIDPKGTAALQIARLAASLPHGGAPRLERLRGFGGRFGRTLVCACSRIMLSDRTPAILIVSTERAGPALPLATQVQRLLIQYDEPIAMFSADGTLLQATAAATKLLRGATALSSLRAGTIMGRALTSGHASGNTDLGAITLDRIGADASTVLVATFAEAALGTVTMATVAPAEPPAAPTPAPPAPEGTIPAEPPAPPVAAPPVAEPPVVEPPTAATPAPVVTPPEPTPAPPAERRTPLRFVWQLDADGRFTIGSDEFVELLGPQTAAALGRPWSEIANALTLDADGIVARAFASRDTWSGLTVAFPVDGSDERLAVDLSGLPVFDRDRSFRGYRGFGICRDVARITELTRARRATGSRATRPRVEPPVLREERPTLTVVPPSENVVPFRSSTPPEKPPTLTPVERMAFRDLANRLTARLRGNETQEPAAREPVAAPAEPPAPTPAPPPEPPAREPIAREPVAREPVARRVPEPPQSTDNQAGDQRPILDRLPVGVLVYRLDRLIYANRAFLDWTGYDSLYALTDAGGLDALFVEPAVDAPNENNGSKALTIATNRGDQLPVEGRLFSTPWDGESALVLMLSSGKGAAAAATDSKQKISDQALQSARSEADELRSILNSAIDGVVVLDRDARVVSLNRSAETLFGHESRELVGVPLVGLFAPESQRVALDALSALQNDGGGAPHEGHEVLGRARKGGTIPLFMTLARVSDGSGRVCAVFRDIAPWKKAEQELLDAKRHAEKASSAKSDFLAKISHEIRTPLNAIIGFSEVMMEERFGPVGNERYKQYLKDIHASGGHLVSLLNDLLDLSKIEAGKLDLTFSAMDLNELIQQSVALMQPQASRERVIIRTSLAPALPQVMADARSVRQIVLNLLSNSIKFTGAGGQVIVSTTAGDDGRVVLHVRDTGVGMSEKEIAIALEPFRQLATSARWGSGGTGLGLPLTKALAEANRASFSIKSAVNAGTLVEVAFPGARLAAE